MNLKFERVFDDQDFSVWRIGGWEFTRTISGETYWEFVGGEPCKKIPKPKPASWRRKRVA